MRGTVYHHILRSNPSESVFISGAVEAVKAVGNGERERSVFQALWEGSLELGTCLDRFKLTDLAPNLIALPADVFIGVPSLWALFLNDNELTTLPADVFEPLTSLTDRLFLENNPGAPFAPSAVALPDDGTVPSAGGTVMLDGSDSGGAWGAYVTYSWALTHPATGVTVVFDDPASAMPTVTIPPLLANTELTFTLTVTGRAEDQRHGEGKPDADGGDHGHCGRRRADQPHIHVPVDSGER